MANRMRLRDELLKLHEKYWDYSDVTEEQMRLYSLKRTVSSLSGIADRVIAICVPFIISCSDYPDIVHRNSIESRVVEMHRKETPVTIASWEERTHTAALACYELSRNYIRTGKDVPFLQYIRQYLPLKYLRGIRTEEGQCRTGFIGKSALSHEEGSLPSEPKEYIDNYVKDNAAEFCREHFKYIGRTNLYRIIKGLDIPPK
jgi:hypothetical protein